MLAVHALSASAQAWLYLLAVALFVLAVIVSVPARSTPPPRRTRYAAWALPLYSLGLAVLAFVHLWNAWALS